MVAPLLLTRGLSALVHGIETPARATQVLAFLSLGTFRLGKLEDGRACYRRGRGRGRGLGSGACRAVPEIAAARRAARRDEVGIASVGLASRDAAKLGRERAGDLVFLEPPATPRGGRAPRRASGTRGELAGSAAPRACRSRSGSGRRSGCRGGTYARLGAAASCSRCCRGLGAANRVEIGLPRSLSHGSAAPKRIS